MARNLAQVGVGAGRAGTAARLAIVARVEPGQAGQALGPMSAQLTVQDASGATYMLPAGTIAADGNQHDLVAQVAPPDQAAYPLRLLGASRSIRRLVPGALVVGGIANMLLADSAFLYGDSRATGAASTVKRQFVWLPPVGYVPVPSMRLLAP
jgi:hypothetical protein